jgi:hypothetical protein
LTYSTRWCNHQAERRSTGQPWKSPRNPAYCNADSEAPNEWIKAQRFRDQYRLSVVVDCKIKPDLYLIEDPASKSNPREEVSVVRYMIELGDWRRVASESSSPGLER